MPSPFPGMDPYLEGDLWTTLHHALAAEIIRHLAPKLRPRYVALAEKRFVAATDDGAVAATDTYPDVGITASDFIAEASQATEAPLYLETVVGTGVPYSSVEIRSVSDRRLVTAIEILSPTNKAGGGRVEYLTRRQRILMSEAHLLEIDLLRRGARVPMREPLLARPYYVFLSRAGARPVSEVWPVALTDPLPMVPVPLLDGDPDVRLDLQAAFTSAYEVSGYDLLVDYSQPPEVPLAGVEAKQAAEILDHAGDREVRP